MKRFDAIRCGYGAFLNGVCAVAGLCVLATMLLVTINSVSRTFFNLPVPGTVELTEGLLTITIFFSLARAQFLGKHVRAMVLVHRLSGTPRWAMELLALVAGLLFSLWAAWGFWQFSVKSYDFGETEVGALIYPLYPLKFAATAGLALLCIEYLLEIVAYLVGGPSASATPAGGGMTDE